MPQFVNAKKSYGQLYEEALITEFAEDFSSLADVLSTEAKLAIEALPDLGPEIFEVSEEAARVVGDFFREFRGQYT